MTIEEVIKRYLEEYLSVPVMLEYPKRPPDKFILIERVGGSEVNHLCAATFAMQSYGQTMYQAAQLNNDLNHAMAAMIEVPVISRVSLNSDYNFTDTRTKEYRYQAVYDISYYKR